MRSVLQLAHLSALCVGTIAATNVSAATERAALILKPTAQSRAALQQVVNKALHHAEVHLAEDALTQDSALIIESARTRDHQGQVIYDRAVPVVEHFRLVRNGRACVLIRESTGERFVLAHTQCVAKT